MIEYYPTHVQAAFEIQQMRPGEIYPFERLRQLCRQNHEAYDLVRARLGDECRSLGFNIKAKRGKGYVVVPDSERVKRQERLYIQKARRNLFRGAQDLRSIDVLKLSSQEVLSLSRGQSRIGTLLAVMRLREPQRYTLSKMPEVPKLGMPRKQDEGED